MIQKNSNNMKRSIMNTIKNKKGMISRKEKSFADNVGQINKLVEGSKIIGDLFADQNLRIDGEIKGNVSTSSKVVIGEKGKITGNLICLEADIEGTVEGTISVEGLLILRKSSLINGDIYTYRIQIDEGAAFNGQCKMGKKPSTSQAKPQAIAESAPLSN